MRLDFLKVGLTWPFTLRENTFKGETTLQAEWLDHHIVEEPVVEMAGVTAIRIIDLRKESEPLSAAKNVYAKGSFLIFQEPPVFDDPDSVGRVDLRAVDTLILASIPPSRQVLEDLLRTCHPKQIVLAFEPSGEISLGSFLKHLAGLIQYAVSNREGLASLEDLAQAMNSRNESIEAGIRWLNASGKIEIISR